MLSLSNWLAASPNRIFATIAIFTLLGCAMERLPV
jgi:hypothetical protein